MKLVALIVIAYLLDIWYLLVFPEEFYLVSCENMGMTRSDLNFLTQRQCS